jgi:tetratricopeptide (TPR) repeat protein
MFVFYYKKITHLDLHFLLLPVFTYLTPVLLLSDSLGVRYLLPIYPFLFLLAGFTAAHLWDSAVKKMFLISILCWQIGGSLLTYPDYLPYFNELIGKRENGFRYLDDSNIDWGQDNDRVLNWLKAKGWENEKIYWFGFPPLEPEAYNISATTLNLTELAAFPAGIYIISRHMAIRLPPFYWLRYDSSLAESIGDSLLAVQINNNSRQKIKGTFERLIQEEQHDAYLHYAYGLILAVDNKIGLAFSSIQRAIQLRPDFGQALYMQGLLLLMTNQAEAAIQRFEKAWQLQPQHPDYMEKLDLARKLARKKNL